MATIPEVAHALQRLLTTTADGAAVASGFVRRRSKVSGSVFVRTLVFGWLTNPAASLGALSQTSALFGVRVSPQALDQRFTPAAAACLEQVLGAATGAVVAADPVAVPILRRFAGVYIQDSTTIGLPGALAERFPGCGNASTPAARSAALKLQVRLELATGALDGPVPHAGRTHDRAAPPGGAPVPPGALRLADLGYFSLDSLAALTADGVFWLSRLQVQTAIFDATGARQAVPAWLGAQRQPALDRPVTLGVRHRLRSPPSAVAACGPRGAAAVSPSAAVASPGPTGRSSSPTCRPSALPWTRRSGSIGRAGRSNCSSSSGRVRDASTTGARPSPGASSARSTPNSSPCSSNTGSCSSVAGMHRTAASPRPPRRFGPWPRCWPPPSPRPATSSPRSPP